MKNRRQFLRRSAFLSLTPLVPNFLLRSTVGAENRDSDRILVVIQLSGGNDGINTIVPMQDEGYAKYRQDLRIAKPTLLEIDGDSGFHPQLRGLADLFEDGRLSIAHAVGYPNPNRSHFESMDIWQTAEMNAQRRKNDIGWLGAAASVSESPRGPHAFHVGDSDLPIALRGRRCVTTSLSSFDDLSLAMSDQLVTGDVGGNNPSSDGTQSLTDFIHRSVSTAYASAQELSENTNVETKSRYPSSGLAQRLKIIAQVIKSRSAGRIYYTSQAGYDTHASQVPIHSNLLGTLSSSLKAFMDDLQDAGLQDRVLVMAFSEFGRRVRENASAGTDHGTAGPVLLAGSTLAKRQYGKIPSLTDLESGDLKYDRDFRDLYATILQDWLQWRLPENLNGFGMDELFGSTG